MGKITGDQVTALRGGTRRVGIGGCTAVCATPSRRLRDQFHDGDSGWAHPGNDGVEEYSVRITDRSHFISQDIGDYTVRSEAVLHAHDPSITSLPSPASDPRRDGRTSRTAPSICRGMDRMYGDGGLLPLRRPPTPPRSLNLKPRFITAASSGRTRGMANSAGLAQSGVGRCLRPRQVQSYKPWPTNHVSARLDPARRVGGDGDTALPSCRAGSS